ncbi:MAG: HIT family protein [Candidatus Paceibacterota bacterium]|jgi:diadenosine tetraphosphate (Ap4A) HIT family hydrolase
MKKSCFFCDIQKKKEDKVIIDNRSFFSRYDDFPVNPGHCEIITKKHIVSFFELTKEQLADFYELLQKTKLIVDDKFNPDSYNIGINEGEAAGRTIQHLHIHLIPRYRGDVENPRGGVRNVIPGKGNY